MSGNFWAKILRFFGRGRPEVDVFWMSGHAAEKIVSKFVKICQNLGSASTFSGTLQHSLLFTFECPRPFYECPRPLKILFYLAP